MKDSKYKFFNDVKPKDKKKSLKDRMEERDKENRDRLERGLPKMSKYGYEDGGVPCKKKKKLAALAKLAKLDKK